MRPAIRQKKSLRDSKSLLFDNRHVRLIAWSKPIRDSEVRTPLLIGRGPDTPVLVCVCAFEDACAAAVRQRERWVVEMLAALSLNLICSVSVWQSLKDSADRWIYRKIKQSPLFSKLPQILHLDASFDVIAMRFQSKKGCFSVQKMEWTALRSLHARFTRAASDKRTESGTNPRYSFVLQTVYLLGPEPRAALDHATPLYTALGDTVK